jgi:uncharacterized protein (TIGR02217 family)
MADGFHDVSFPAGIALGSRGGPLRRTQVVTLSSGHERRAAQWAQSRRRWNAGYGVKSARDIEAMIAFFEARQGPRFAFRWRDPFDYSSAAAGEVPAATDQVIGTGDGTGTVFALVKRYAQGGPARAITKPVPGSIIAAVDGVPAAATADPLTGLLTFAVPPAAGAQVTAGFLFDVPARFDTDELVVSLEPGGGDVPEIPIVEVRL